MAVVSVSSRARGLRAGVLCDCSVSRPFSCRWMPAGAAELTVLEAASASLATIGNIGPGFGFLGPFGSYLDFPSTSKLLMILLMWFGRLEIIPVFVIFTGAFWNE